MAATREETEAARTEEEFVFVEPEPEFNNSFLTKTELTNLTRESLNDNLMMYRFIKTVIESRLNPNCKSSFTQVKAYRKLLTNVELLEKLQDLMKNVKDTASMNRAVDDIRKIKVVLADKTQQDFLDYVVANLDRFKSGCEMDVKNSNARRERNELAKIAGRIQNETAKQARAAAIPNKM